MTEVEINDVPLPEALTVIGEQLKLPMLMDHNAMALHGVDPPSRSHAAGQTAAATA